MVRFTALPECAEGSGTRVRNMLREVWTDLQGGACHCKLSDLRPTDARQIDRDTDTDTLIWRCIDM